MMTPKRLFLTAILLFGIIQVHAQTTEYRDVYLGFSVPCRVNVHDVYNNDGVISNNSLSDIEKNISFSNNVLNVAIKGQDFSGTSYSDPFFSYKHRISLKGRFNKDKTMVEWAEVEYTYYQFSGSKKDNFYSEEHKTIKFRVTKLGVGWDKVSYSILPKSDGRIEQLTYKTAYIGQSTHNRREERMETVIRMSPGTTNPAFANLNLGRPKEAPKLPEVTARVGVDDPESQSAKERSLSRGSAGLLYAYLTRIPNLVAYEGIRIDAIQNEIQLVESGLVDPESAIDPEKAKASLEKEVDLQVLIKSKLEWGENDKVLAINIDYRFLYNGNEQVYSYYADLRNTDPEYRNGMSAKNEEVLNLMIGHMVNAIRQQK